MILVEVEELADSVFVLVLVALSVLVTDLVSVSLVVDEVVGEIFGEVVVEGFAGIEDVVGVSLVATDGRDEVVVSDVVVIEVVVLKEIEWLTVTVDRTTSVTGGTVTATVTAGGASEVEVSEPPSTWTTE